MSDTDSGKLGDSEKKKNRVLGPMTLRLLFRMLTRGNLEKKDPSVRTNDFATTFSDVDSGKLGENPNARTNDFAAIFSDVNSGKLGLA